MGLTSENRQINFGLLIMRVGLTAVLLVHCLPALFAGTAAWQRVGTPLGFINFGVSPAFLGATVLLLLFLVLLWRGIHHASAARQPFPRFVAVGVVSYFVFHVVTNVAITTGLMPVTGLPLPLISYGGSNLLTSSILVGLLLNVSARTFND